MAGVFVTFEGPEGAGKSTHIRILADRLRESGRRVVVTREPGGTRTGERIREVLFDRQITAMAAETEALLITAARAQHVKEVILPELRTDAIVLCDRFVDSTLAYQGGGRGLPLAALRELQHFAIGKLTPTRRILLDLDVEIGLGRRMQAAGTTNRLDEEQIEFHQRVRETYLHLAAADPDGWSVIDADQPVDEIAQVIWSVMQNILMGC